MKKHYLNHSSKKTPPSPHQAAAAGAEAKAATTSSNTTASNNASSAPQASTSNIFDPSQLINRFKGAASSKSTSHATSAKSTTGQRTSATMLPSGGNNNNSSSSNKKTTTESATGATGDSSSSSASSASDTDMLGMMQAMSSSGGASKSSAPAAATSASRTSASTTATGAAAAAAATTATGASEFSRLTDLLQSRGLPSHIVNAFGSKVQQFLHRSMSSDMTSRAQQLINTLQQQQQQAHSDDSLKLTALVELCQLLVMGNEDTLVGFPIKQAVPLLLQCMSGSSSSSSDNFELMNHACRALTYMMDALPRSSSIIADGIGIFLEKLQVIQCMDVAEQALTALEILSRRHSKQILNATQAGSVAACLTYIDFFSITAQRNALTITANCAQNMVRAEFVHIQSSLDTLAQRLTHSSDKRSVESVCTLFARLVENFQRDAHILKELASHRVLANMQQLLVAQPPLVGTAMLVTILHTMYLMCANCPELALELVESHIDQTVRTLLVGSNATGSLILHKYIP